ncbi:MAG: DegQ family serine endoprotease [Magnetovibrio sp.]|nr:DegQ family serine endoprotease [Magnetovibrio sp.]
MLKFGSRLLFVMVLWGGSSAFAQNKVVPQSKVAVQFSYAPLVKKTAPAVVNVFTSKTVRARKISPLFNDPFFQRFFGGQLRRNAPGPKKKVQNSLGSGVLIDSTGIIVTNNHVIAGAEEIKVVLSDRREFSAKLVGTDKRTDIAVLKINTGGEALPYLKLSDPDALEIGDLVLAIGNPFGVGQTVTSGIVSAMARTNIGVSDLNSFIQTDAAINPGNSGGALVDMHGRLVGVNTAIFSKSGGSNGIGFAIPVNMVSHVVKSLLTSGGVVRPWFGASGQTVTSDIANALGMKRPVGIMVTSVHGLGSAKKAGVRVGDVLLSINGYELHEVQDLRFRIATQGVGDAVKVTLMRRDGKVTLDMVLEAPPEIPKKNKTLLKGQHPFDGALVANLSPALADTLGLPHVAKGVILLQLDRRKNAARLGLKPGDIVKKINGVEINSVRQLAQIMGINLSGWLVVIDRGGREVKLVVR